MVVPQKNELILVASAISYSFPSSPNMNRKRSTYPTTPPSPSSLGARDKDNDIPHLIKRALVRMTKAPQAISLLLGMRILDEDRNTGKLTFAVCSLPTFFVFLRFIFVIFVSYLFVTYNDIYGKIFGGWGDTERFSHVLSVVTIVICDAIYSTFSFKDANKLDALLTNICGFVVDATTLAVSTLGHPGGGDRRRILGKYLKRLKNIQWGIERKVYVIGVLFVVSFACSILPAFVVVRAIMESQELDKILIFGLPFINFFYVSLHNLRQVVYYGTVGVLKSIWFGLSVLKDLVNYEVTSKDDDGKGKNKEARIKKLLEQFQSVYDLVDDVNVRLQWVLITGSISLLVTITCSAFEFCTWSAAGGIFPVIVSLSCVLSNAMTFYEICAASSDVTREAKACMTLLRDVGPSVAHNRELYHKITMWHMEGTIQPPTISPGYFFTLRRRVLPPIAAMLVTYLLVLVQFNLKDRENGGTEDRNDVLEILRNHSLAGNEN